MGRPVSLQTLGDAARRACRVAPVRPAPVRKRGVMRSVAVRGFFAVVLALVLVAGTANKASAIANPWAAAQVVAQMGTLIAKLAAVKGAVEQQRQQARSFFYGQIAPLASRMKTVNCLLSHANGLSLGFSECLNTGTPEPLRYELPDGQTVLDHVPFNRTIDPCPAGQSRLDCYDPPTTAREVRRLGRVVRRIARGAYPSGPDGYPDQARDRHRRQAEGFRDLAPVVRDQDQAFERRMARQRAVVEGGMGIVEEWRGCQPVLPGGSPDGGDPRLPCVTNRGAGRDAGAGTVGMVQELAAQLKLIEDGADGNASQNQLDTIRTQVGIMRARISAASLELRSMGAEDGLRSQVQAEAGARRRQELFALRMDCLDGRMGRPAHAFNVFYPHPVETDGECIGPPPDVP